MANVTNPFDLLNAVEKKSDSRKAKPAAAPAATNGAGDVSGLSASQKKRRAKKGKAQQNKDSPEPEPAPEPAQEPNPAVSDEIPGYAASDFDENGWLHGAIPPELLDEPIKREEEFQVVSRYRKHVPNQEAKANSSGTPPSEPHLAKPGGTDGTTLPQASETDIQGLVFGTATSGFGSAYTAETSPATVQPAAPGSVQGELPGVPEDVARQLRDGARELEHAARQSWSWPMTSKSQQWKQWALQAQIPPGSGARVPWKQVFLFSQALELTLQGCLDSPVAPDYLPDLQALLSPFLGSPEAALAVAQVTVDLAQVVGSQPGQAQDPALLSSAQEALGAAVSCLKKSLSGWAIRSVAESLSSDAVQGSLASLDNSAMNVGNQLRQIEASAGTSDISSPGSMDKSSCFKELAMIGEKRLSTILGAISANSPDAKSESAELEAQAEALKRVRDLTALILQRKREGPGSKFVPQAAQKATPVTQPRPRAQVVTATGKGIIPAQTNGVVSGGKSHAPEEAELKKSLQEADAEVQSVRKQLEEAEKAVLRLRDVCIQAEARQRELQHQLDAATNPAPASTQASANGVVPGDKVPSLDSLGPASVLPPAEQHQLQCAQQLGTVHALETLLLRRPIAADVPADSAPRTPDEATVWPAVAGAVTEHLRALASLLQNQITNLQGAGQGLRFCQEKMQTLKDDMKTYRAMGRAQMADSYAKPLERAEGLYKARLTEVGAILKEAESVEAALHQPDLRTAVALLPLLPEVHLLLQQIGTTLHQIRKEHAALMEPLPAAATSDSKNKPAAPVKASSQPQQPQQQQPGGSRPQRGGSQGKKRQDPVGPKPAAQQGQAVRASTGTQGAPPEVLDAVEQGARKHQQLTFEPPPKSVWQKPAGVAAQTGE